MDFMWSLFKSDHSSRKAKPNEMITESGGSDDRIDGEYLQIIDTSKIPTIVKLISGQKLRQLSHMHRYQDIDPQYWQWDEPPLCVCFVSHRWKSTVHPDPNGERIRALHFLLDTIRDIASIYHRPLNERLEKFPTLERHGVLQAASIVDKIAQSGSPVDSSILSRIGIWVDFLCLPQKTLQGVDERTDEELVAFRHGLRLLPTLVASSNFIVSIRVADDDYIGRAWCISELCFASFKYHRNVIVLREDLLGQPIDAGLLQTDQQGYEGTMMQNVRDCIRSWEHVERFAGNEMSLGYYYADLEVSEENRIIQHEDDQKTWPTPFFTTGRVPRIFPNHATFLMNVRTILSVAPPKNVTLLVTRMALLSGMNCNEVDDYLVCGLHILRARLSGHVGFKVFFDDCLFRWSQGKHLVLAEPCAKAEDDHISMGPLKYRFEMDQRMISLHDKATRLWKQHHMHEERDHQYIAMREAINRKYSILTEALLRQLMLLETSYDRYPDLGVMDLSEITTCAMDVAKISCQGSKAETGLVLVYAHCQSIVGINIPGSHKLSALLLHALERVSDDKNLFISNYRDFECTFVMEMTTDLIFKSLRHTYISENLRLDLAVAATGLPVLEV